jgi:hypothetical protein
MNGGSEPAANNGYEALLLINYFLKDKSNAT